MPPAWTKVQWFPTPGCHRVPCCGRRPCVGASGMLRETQTSQNMAATTTRYCSCIVGVLVVALAAPFGRGQAKTGDAAGDAAAGGSPKIPAATSQPGPT